MRQAPVRPGARPPRPRRDDPVPRRAGALHNGHPAPGSAHARRGPAPPDVQQERRIGRHVQDIRGRIRERRIQGAGHTHDIACRQLPQPPALLRVHDRRVRIDKRPQRHGNHDGGAEGRDQHHRRLCVRKPQHQHVLGAAGRCHDEQRRRQQLRPAVHHLFGQPGHAFARLCHGQLQLGHLYRPPERRVQRDNQCGHRRRLKDPPRGLRSKLEAVLVVGLQHVACRRVAAGRQLQSSRAGPHPCPKGARHRPGLVPARRGRRVRRQGGVSGRAGHKRGRGLQGPLAPETAAQRVPRRRGQRVHPPQRLRRPQRAH